MHPAYFEAWAAFTDTVIPDILPELDVADLRKVAQRPEKTSSAVSGSTGSNAPVWAAAAVAPSITHDGPEPKTPSTGPISKFCVDAQRRPLSYLPARPATIPAEELPGGVIKGSMMFGMHGYQAKWPSKVNETIAQIVIDGQVLCKCCNKLSKDRVAYFEKHMFYAEHMSKETLWMYFSRPPSSRPGST